MKHTERDKQFTAYVAVQGPALQRFGYLLTGDKAAAEDLVQAALLQVLRHWSRVREREALDAYVRRTMLNHQRSLWRRRSSSEVVTDSPGEPPSRDRSRVLDERQDLLRELRRLPPKQRAAVVLRYYEDLPESEVAHILGCSIGTVKSQTSRGLAKLRSQLEAVDYKGEPHNAC